MNLKDINYTYLPGPESPATLIEECVSLYSNHYGIWGPQGRLPGQRVKSTVAQLRQLLSQKQSWIAVARDNTMLIGYALVVRDNVPDCGQISWVTQLVVHENFRGNGIATELLNSMWGFSDHCGWGLVTANPFAVRALEKATRRRCDPKIIQKYVQDLQRFGDKLVPYAKGCSVQITSRNAQIDTKFFQSHGEVPQMLKDASNQRKWTLGDLDEGKEWFAFTFRIQPEFKLNSEELEKLLQNSDKTVVRAYEGMSLDASHRWAQHWRIECDWLESYLDLKPGDRILDFGCGKGRHALELGRRGITVVGVDIVERFVNEATEQARSGGINGVTFRAGDCRKIDLMEQFDAAICLYDVVGSHPEPISNQEILNNLARHVKPGGKMILSVMNREPAIRNAKTLVDISKKPGALLDLKPSRTMQTTGNIWNPDFYLIDKPSGLVYRKEQFEAPGLRLPCELVVRDKRYLIGELVEMCTKAGFRETWTKRVQAGHWDESLGRSDDKAREILYCGERMEAEK